MVPIRPKRVAAWAGAALLVVLMVWILRPVLTTLVLAFGVAWLLHPFVDRLERRRIPRSLSILFLLSLVFAAVPLAVGLLAPLVEHEVKEMAANVPDYVNHLSTTYENDLRPWVARSTGYKLPPNAKAFWKENGQKLLDAAPDIAEYAWKAIRTTLGDVVGLIGFILDVILFPVFVFYLLKDFRRLRDGFFDMIPMRHRGVLELELFEVDRVLAAFVRGQMTVAILLAVVYGIGLSVIGIDLAVVIGCVAGLCFFIPYAGYVVGLALASMMSIAKFGFDVHLLYILALFGVAGLLEANVISPKIVGERVGLHPVVMITAVIVGGEMFGFLGVLLAVPATAIIAVFWRAGWARYRESEFFVARK